MNRVLGLARRIALRVFIILAVTITWTQGNAQINKTEPNNINSVFPDGSVMSQRELLIAAMILIYGIAIMLPSLFIIAKEKANPDAITRFSACIFIVTGALFLVAAGYSGQDIAPVLGLLGTIAGYVLGRSDRRDRNMDARESRRENSQTGRASSNDSSTEAEKF